MKFTKLTVLIVSTLFFAGCTPAIKDMINKVTKPTSTDDAMIQEENLEKTTQEVMEKGESKEGESNQEASEFVMAENDKVQLNASNFTFKVNEIRAKVGDKLTVMVTVDSGTHDFVIDELDISTGVIPVGETKIVSIPTDKPGTYEYYCSIGKHRELGMKGVLIIE